MVSTSRKDWDNPELDILDAFKGISFISLSIFNTACFTVQTSSNTWRLFDFF